MHSANRYASSVVLTQAVDGPDVLTPIAYTTDCFSDMQQK